MLGSPIVRLSPSTLISGGETCLKQPGTEGNEVQVSIGEFVPQGSTVGLSGSAGYSTGRHAHVMRMAYCGELTCQSIPLAFVEAGVPVTGQVVTSENCPDRA